MYNKVDEQLYKPRPIWRMIDWQPWNITVGETRTLVNIVLRLHNADYEMRIIYSQLFISFLPIASSSRRRCTQLVQWLNYVEISDVIGTRSLIYRRFSSVSSFLSTLSGSYDLHNGLSSSSSSFPLLFLLLSVKFSRTKCAACTMRAPWVSRITIP